jgi:spermidine synthase
VHLLTREAFQTYFRHLKPEGVLAVHVSNRYLDLAPVVAKVAAAFGKSAAQVASPGDEKAQTLLATWILVGGDLEFPRVAAKDELRLWTDDYSNLFQVLKR